MLIKNIKDNIRNSNFGFSVVDFDLLACKDVQTIDENNSVWLFQHSCSDNKFEGENDLPTGIISKVDNNGIKYIRFNVFTFWFPLDRESDLGYLQDFPSCFVSFSKIPSQLLEYLKNSMFIINNNINYELSEAVHKAKEEEIQIPFGVGVAGTVAETKQVVNIRNAYQIKKCVPLCSTASVNQCHIIEQCEYVHDIDIKLENREQVTNNVIKYGMTKSIKNIVGDSYIGQVTIIKDHDDIQMKLNQLVSSEFVIGRNASNATGTLTWELTSPE
ncbi:hypothetical protein AGLY_001460 [Aphis glycines]|uniref:Uncharacterized protein n=1 Tax=Aphis glycines TaxID=307491 RepID=A0A6G0U580_APHGL|nr:hypothetical protein AGLY_001460 [Aphis glycines]